MEMETGHGRRLPKIRAIPATPVTNPCHFRHPSFILIPSVRVIKGGLDFVTLFPSQF